MRNIFKEMKIFLDENIYPLLKSIALFSVAVSLFFLVTPFGLLYKFLNLFINIRRIVPSILRVLSKFFGSVAYSIDLLANNLCEELFNDLFLKEDKTEPFGDIEETISSVLGKNRIKSNLTWFGEALSKGLDFIDENHVIKYIKRCI